MIEFVKIWSRKSLLHTELLIAEMKTIDEQLFTRHRDQIVPYLHDRAELGCHLVTFPTSVAFHN
ncbi:hypothetical protein T12_3367 [Trichinella patagoniensis]|uniref:Uncharacterized protein n=1 Tax=Trichinella patagoniensis TaxID=990121 RepID=A0A0V1AGB5_9BILA|nr:hypothetical protein T12_3367 [Trichinella patagoniensis]